jgi:hypothetical protein
MITVEWIEWDIKKLEQLRDSWETMFKDVYWQILEIDFVLNYLKRKLLSIKQ